MSIFEIRSFLGLAGYYRRCENGLKLSIRGRIVGFRIRDMDSMVGTTGELHPIFVKNVGSPDIHEYSAGLRVVNGPPGFGASQYISI